MTFVDFKKSLLFKTAKTISFPLWYSWESFTWIIQGAAPMELDASDDSQPLGEHAIEANDLVPWTASNGGHVGYFSNAPKKGL